MQTLSTNFSITCKKEEHGCWYLIERGFCKRIWAKKVSPGAWGFCTRCGAALCVRSTVPRDSLRTLRFTNRRALVVGSRAPRAFLLKNTVCFAFAGRSVTLFEEHLFTTISRKVRLLCGCFFNWEAAFPIEEFARRRCRSCSEPIERLCISAYDFEQFTLLAKRGLLRAATVEAPWLDHGVDSVRTRRGDRRCACTCEFDDAAVYPLNSRMRSQCGSLRGAPSTTVVIAQGSRWGRFVMIR